jgi:hypothetical protein
MAKIKNGNVRLQLSISPQADKLLRTKAKRKGEISQIIEQLILLHCTEKTTNASEYVGFITHYLQIRPGTFEEAEKAYQKSHENKEEIECTAQS